MDSKEENNRKNAEARKILDESVREVEEDGQNFLTEDDLRTYRKSIADYINNRKD